MKRYFVLFLIIPFLFSCNKKKIEQLETRSDSLLQQANLKDESINEFLRAFNDIQENLDSIKTKEMIITENTEGQTELKPTAKDQINQDINAIYLLLTDTKTKLDDVRKKLGKANYQVQELEKMVAHLTKQIQEKDAEIESLRLELEKMNIKVTALTADVDKYKQITTEQEGVIKEKEGTIVEKDTELNTAYFAKGTKKELKDNNIITAEGGFVGIGKNKKLKSDFNEKFFTKIDIRETSQIPIPGKKEPKVVTTHPAESWKITGEGDARILEILNRNEFWKASKYLVIIVE
jgi:hypothetical protein